MSPPWVESKIGNGNLFRVKGLKSVAIYWKSEGLFEILKR